MFAACGLMQHLRAYETQDTCTPNFMCVRAHLHAQDQKGAADSLWHARKTQQKRFLKWLSGASDAHRCGVCDGRDVLCRKDAWAVARTELAKMTGFKVPATCFTCARAICSCRFIDEQLHALNVCLVKSLLCLSCLSTFVLS
jgi:hypothetical protein